MLIATYFDSGGNSVRDPDLVLIDTILRLERCYGSLTLKQSSPRQLVVVHQLVELMVDLLHLTLAWILANTLLFYEVVIEKI